MSSYNTWASSMDYEYQYTNVFPQSSLSHGKQHTSPSIEPATPTEKSETHDLFVPKSYFNTGVHTALDQTMSTQLDGISLAETTTSSEKDDDQKNADSNDEQNASTAIVPYHRSLPTLPSDYKGVGTISNTTTGISSRRTPSFQQQQEEENEENDAYTQATTMDRSSSMNTEQYKPQLYPTASFYHHDPVAHQTSLVNYFAGMIQIGCQLVLFFFFLYIGYQFILALNEDVASKIQVYESEYMDKHFLCEQEYHRNQCHNNNRPAMVEPCRQWLQCLYTPAWIGKTKVLAETFAEIANGFVDTISLKTMVFGILIIITTLWFSSQGKPRIGQQQPQHPPHQALQGSSSSSFALT